MSELYQASVKQNLVAAKRSLLNVQESKSLLKHLDSEFYREHEALELDYRDLVLFWAKREVQV